MLHAECWAPFPRSPAQAANESGPSSSFQQPTTGSLVLSARLQRPLHPAPRLGAGLCCACCAVQRLAPEQSGGSLLRLVDEHAESLDPADREGLDVGPPHHQRLRVVRTFALGRRSVILQRHGCVRERREAAS